MAALLLLLCATATQALQGIKKEALQGIKSYLDKTREGIKTVGSLYSQAGSEGVGRWGGGSPSNLII